MIYGDFKDHTSQEVKNYLKDHTVNDEYIKDVSYYISCSTMSVGITL